MTLANVTLYLNFLSIYNKFYTTSNLFWSEKQGFKIGCISPIMIFKKKYKTKVANDPEYLTLTPPE